MADYNLDIEIEATTGRLAGGLRKAEGMMRKSAAKMRGAFGKMDGLKKHGAKAGKSFMGGMAGAIGAAAIATVITGALDAAVAQSNPETRKQGQGILHTLFQGMADGIEKIPIVGQVGRLIGNALGAKSFEEGQIARKKAQEEVAKAARRRARAAEVEAAYIAHVKAENEKLIQQEKERNEAIAERARLVAAFDAEQQAIADNLMEREMRAAAFGDDAAQRKITADREFYDARLQIEQRIADLRENEQFFEAKRLELQKQAMLERLKEVQAMEEAAIVAAEQKEAEEERIALQEEANEKQAKAIKEFAKARMRAEKEVAEAKDEATRQAANATASFSTAGGSFTTAVSAQVNEAKVLNKISQQSRDFLQTIVTNTARLGGIGFA